MNNIVLILFHISVLVSDESMLIIDLGEQRLMHTQNPDRIYEVSVGKDSWIYFDTHLARADNVHVVSETQSLWEISRQYRVNVDVLKAFNELENDLIKPGLALIIPDGQFTSVTPIGEFQVTSMIENPYQFDDEDELKPYLIDKRNEFGTHWIGLNSPGIGIHGTNDPESVPGFTSSGCIRMKNRDILEIFEMIETGTTVVIVK
jgi:hypothetical protein